MSSPTTIAPEPIPEETAQAALPKRATWSVGTLIYTKPQIVTLFFWLLWGDFAWSMKDRSVSPVAQLILKQYHASDLLMSVLLAVIPAAVGIVLGPVISFRSDRTRSKWGRRLPFLMATVPFAALSIVGLGFCAQMGAWLHTLLRGADVASGACVLASFGFFWVLFDIASVAANAVFGALINDVVPAEFLGRFYGLFRAVSLIAGMIFNYKLIGFADKHFDYIFLGVGLLYGVGFMFTCFRVKEGGYPPVDDSAHGAQLRGVYAASVYARECFSAPYYRWVIAAIVISGLVFMPVNLFSLPFAQSLHITTKMYGQYLALTYLISLCLSYLLGYLTDRFHPLTTGIVAMAAYAVTSLGGGLLATGQTSFAIFLVAHGVISGTFFTCTASLGQKLFPRMKYAQFASAAGVVAALLNIVVAPVVGEVLDKTGHAYRITCDIGFVLALASLGLMLGVLRRFNGLGGTAAYVPPAA